MKITIIKKCLTLASLFAPISPFLFPFWFLNVPFLCSPFPFHLQGHFFSSAIYTSTKTSQPVDQKFDRGLQALLSILRKHSTKIWHLLAPPSPLFRSFSFWSSAADTLPSAASPSALQTAVLCWQRLGSNRPREDWHFHILGERVYAAQVIPVISTSNCVGHGYVTYSGQWD